MDLTREQLVKISEEAMKIANEAADNGGFARVIANPVAAAIVAEALKAENDVRDVLLRAPEPAAHEQ